MSDPLLPPPRRPAPEHLRDRIASDLDRAAGRRFRVRYLAAPAAAAALVAIIVLGASTFSGHRTTQPATPSPAPVSTGPSVTQTPDAPRPRRSATTTAPVPAAPLDLDVRAMTEQEINRDRTSCAAVEQSPGRVSDPTAQYARIQHPASVDGPSSTQVRMLVDQDADQTVSCQNGSDPDSGGGSADGLARPTTSVPAVEVADFGTVQGDCATRASSEVTTSELYAVADPVATGRIRINRGKEAGPWQLTTPLDGLVSFPIALTGDDAWTVPLSFDVEFLDRDGKRVTIQPHGATGTKTTKRQTTAIETCSSLQRQPEPTITRPGSTADGKADCLAMATDGDPEGGSFPARSWKTELVVSTKTEWGAVLSDGKRRFGCSLYPTREVSRVTVDSSALSTASFFFALNPIAANDGVSLWAAGRAPQDVSKITYALPGDRSVVAQIAEDGYWMLKYHVDGAELAPGSTSDWPAVVVTVERSSGTRTYRIPFTEESMCNQVSHGC
jgi:hypothetical protein